LSINVVNIVDHVLRNEPILFDAVDFDAYVARPAVEEVLVEAVEMSRGVLLVGPAGSGRTTTLNWLARKLPGRTVARVDAALTDTPAALLEAIRVALVSALGGVDTAGGRGLSESPVVGQATTEPVRLQAMARQLRGVPNAVVIIDNLVDPSVIRTIFGGLRELLWETRYTYVCSARPQDVPVFLAPPADSFFRRRVPLTPLTDDELERMLVMSELPIDDARHRIEGVPRQPRQVIAAMGAAMGSDFEAPATKGVSRAAGEVWRELVSLHRPVTVTDDELRLRAQLSSISLRRHLNELVDAGLVAKLNERTGRPGRPAVVYQARSREEIGG
jgi:energy-coupling factor transporter ATP-binding protein EcfA2